MNTGQCFLDHYGVNLFVMRNVGDKGSGEREVEGERLAADPSPPSVAMGSASIRFAAFEGGKQAML